MGFDNFDLEIFNARNQEEIPDEDDEVVFRCSFAGIEDLLSDSGLNDIRQQAKAAVVSGKQSIVIVLEVTSEQELVGESLQPHQMYKLGMALAPLRKLEAGAHVTVVFVPTENDEE